MIAALMPLKLLVPGPRHLRDIRADETAYVKSTALLVGSDRSCFVNLNADILLHQNGSAISVTKREEGAFDVAIPSGVSYSRDKTALEPIPGHLEPVASITILEPDPAIGVK
jgi:hypothetical protein